MRSEHSDEQSAEQLQEVDHPGDESSPCGSCASPDAIFRSHRLVIGRDDFPLRLQNRESRSADGRLIVQYMLAEKERLPVPADRCKALLHDFTTINATSAQSRAKFTH